jgi:hypothetical protein
MEIDVGLVIAGAIGALIAIFVRKQDVTWDAPLWGDTADLIKQRAAAAERVQKTQNDLDALQDILAQGVDAADLERLRLLALAYENGLNSDKTTHTQLERSIDRRNIVSRIAGFILYVVIGGFLAAFLASRVTIEGFTTGFPDYLKAVPIGFAWTSVLSLFGIKVVEGKYDVRIQEAKTEVANEIEEAKKRIERMLKPAASADSEALRNEDLLVTLGMGNGNRQEALSTVLNELDRTKARVSRDFDVARAQVSIDAKGAI